MFYTTTGRTHTVSVYNFALSNIIIIVINFGNFMYAALLYCVELIKRGDPGTRTFLIYGPIVHNAKYGTGKKNGRRFCPPPGRWRCILILSVALHMAREPLAARPCRQFSIFCRRPFRIKCHNIIIWSRTNRTLSSVPIAYTL